jgi:hypothetical protein
MYEKGLYKTLINRFEGECPLDITSDIGKTFIEIYNVSIRRQIANGFLDDIILIFRNNKLSYINSETMNYFSDYLEGKLKKKKGAKFKSNYFRDELITLKMMELVMLHKSVTEALIIMNKLDAYGLGVKSLEAIYYRNVNDFEKNLTIEQVRKRGLKTQAIENRQISRQTHNAIKFFTPDQS